MRYAWKRWMTFQILLTISRVLENFERLYVSKGVKDLLNSLFN